MFTTFLDVSRAELESPCQRGAFEGIIASAFGNDPGKRQLLLEIIGTIISPELIEHEAAPNAPKGKVPIQESV